MAMNDDRHVLIVGGTDSSGGAGISRDMETAGAYGLRTCVAITAVTVQTHQAVGHIELMKAHLVAEQMRAAFQAARVAAVKIGMLGTKGSVEAVASVLSAYPSIPIVLDPVLASTSGKSLLAPDALDVLKRRLLPLCTLATPNIPELALLSGSSIATEEADAIGQAQTLMKSGCRAVLVKGGHATGPASTDLLLRPGRQPSRFDAPRLAVEMRGTGCMLASAVAVHAALGEPLEASVEAAKQFVFNKLARSMLKPQ